MLQAITTRYPGIAPVMAAMAIPLWASLAADGWMLPVSCILGWWLLALAIVDIRHFLLPDILTMPLTFAGLGVAFFLGSAAFVSALSGAAIGFAAFFLVREGYRLLRRREGLGFGDVKLLAALGAWLGWAGLPSVVLIASLGGLVSILPRLVHGAALAPEQKLPFGAHLCFGAWLVWLHGPLVPL